MTTHGEGIFLDMSEADYRAAPGVNVSALKSMRLSPAHYKHAREEQEDKKNAALIVGTLVHRANLEPDRLCYAVRPNAYPATKTHKSVKDGTLAVGDPVPWNSNAKWCQDWLASQTLPVVTEDQVEIVNRCADALAGFELFPGVTLDDLCAIGNKEVAVFKRHRRTGIMRKARIDLLAIDEAKCKWAFDLKTVPEEGACRDAFSRKIADLNYHMQDAWYSDILEDDIECEECGALADATNKTNTCEYCHTVGSVPTRPPINFVFIAVEKTGYPGVAAWTISQRGREVARRTNEALLEQLHRCLKNEEWTGYPKGVRTIDLPGWKIKQDGSDIQ